jgi:hypothetical protein
MDIGTWLRGLGLDRYEAAFRENEIDETVLPSLTLEDLKDLGVSLVGHRRKLLDAIAALRTDTSPKDAVREQPAPASAPAKDTAERRQVTVMFSDLVGSTARGPCRIGGGCGSRRTATYTAADADRYRDRSRCRRRSDRVGGRAGARHCRRNAEPGRAPAGGC